MSERSESEGQLRKWDLYRHPLVDHRSSVGAVEDVFNEAQGKTSPGGNRLIHATKIGREISVGFISKIRSVKPPASRSQVGVIGGP